MKNQGKTLRDRRHNNHWSNDINPAKAHLSLCLIILLTIKGSNQNIALYGFGHEISQNLCYLLFQLDMVLYCFD